MKELIYRVPDLRGKEQAIIYSNRVVCVEPTEYHAHHFVEIAFIEEGSGIHKIDNTCLVCNAGDLFLLNSQVKHQFVPDPGTSITICNSVFLPEFFDYSLIGSENIQTLSNIFLFRSFFVDEPVHYISIHADEEAYFWLKTLFMKIDKEYLIEESGYLELIRAYIIELLIYILRKSQYINGKNGIEFPGKDANTIIKEKVIAYIEAHFTEDITIAELSVLAFLSPAQLCRVFKQYTGFTVKRFIQKTRVEVACRLLCETGKSISDISLSVGYQDTKFFTQLFGRLMCMSPSAFRKMRQLGRSSEEDNVNLQSKFHL